MILWRQHWLLLLSLWRAAAVDSDSAAEVVGVGVGQSAAPVGWRLVWNSKLWKAACKAQPLLQVQEPAIARAPPLCIVAAAPARTVAQRWQLGVEQHSMWPH